MEIWDLYDRDGNRTGETWERQFGNYKQIPDGRYHMVVDILVQHVDGTYLLTKRDESKDVYPGYWEASAGGSAVSGEEPLEAAKRELLEETGLTAMDFKLVSHIFRDPSHSMFYSYLATVDADKDSVVLQEGETVAYKWVDKKDFIEYAESDKSIKTHNSRYSKLIEDLKTEINKEVSVSEAIGDKDKTLYVTDLDGTLMRSDKSISAETVSIINELIQKGLQFTVATARSAMSVRHIVEPFDIKVPLIIRNGTALADPKTLDIIEKALFTDKQIDELKELLPEIPSCGFTSIWYDNEMEKVFFAGEHSVGIRKYLDERKSEKGIRIVNSIDALFSGDVGYITMIDDKEKLDPIYERVKGKEGWEAVLQKDAYDEEYWLEICPENSTKAKAIVKLKEKLGMERIVVFGDSVNDIPMFKIADEAYAVGNALPELKKYATGIIASNEEDGVAKFLLDGYHMVS